jgi:hypothetical protein
MSEVQVLDPEQDVECCCCRSSNVRLHQWADAPPLGNGQLHQHCDLCYETLAGNSCTRPLAYDWETAKIMKHINNVANILLRELKK